MKGLAYRIGPEGTKTVTESLRLISMKGEIFYLAKMGYNPLSVAFKLTTAILSSHRGRC
ncbi:MAG: hypothetical protein M2R45_04459 [Verrucomicrobia subdivision 3 bacterium]|nr:hypothetical protein [Limisphaerales bacterium]MCS1415010.1 hypothetical protein [Limisphaerales bacterium]